VIILPTLRRALLLPVLLAGLAWPSVAAAAPPLVTATATPSSGAAPLTVTLAAAGDAATYAWDLGDGTTSTGPAVQHVYAAGSYTATVTATAADGETAQAQAQVTAVAPSVALKAPRAASYGARGLFHGRLTPGATGARVTIKAAGRAVGTATTTGGGFFRLRLRVLRPGPYTAQAGSTVSKPVWLTVHPSLTASLVGDGMVGSRLELRARARPLYAGKVRVRVLRNGKQVADRRFSGPVNLRLGTGAAVDYTLRVTLVPARGWSRAGKQLHTLVHVPTLSPGSRGPSVYALEQLLYAQHYALSTVDSTFSSDTRDAVYAFQKVHGLARTGSVGPVMWHLLERSTAPLARYKGDHVEVDKTKQVLFIVRGGKVVLISHVSTGATGNTPLGIWHVYGKTPGWLPDGMFDSSFFLRGFAVHGYPSVPPYPASHGCVRLPVWLAPRIYSMIPVGSEVIIYL